MRIDARNKHYQELNELIHQAAQAGNSAIVLDNVNGQRYIGGGLSGELKITINGVPGNDLASFMDGPTLIVNDNAQDGIANTMNAGKVVVHGSVGDIAGHSMRGGKLYIQGDAGYRVGIHMKSYKDLYPVIIIGGRAGDFLGEYMAGGLIIVLGLNSRDRRPLAGNYLGTGMHGGKIYIRGKIADYQLGKEVKPSALNKQDKAELEQYLEQYCREFNLDLNKLKKAKFTKFIPYTTRPYGKLYAY